MYDGLRLHLKVLLMEQNCIYNNYSLIKKAIDNCNDITYQDSVI